jgi:L-lactate dehydrogenase
MEVDGKQTPFNSDYKGHIHHFCTARCKASFERDPDKYLRLSEGSRIEERKIVVVGTGQVGSSFAFALMMSGLADRIVLIDKDRELSEGHAMDLNHSMPFSQPAIVHAGDYRDCRDAGIVVITAGVPQKPGESRLALARKNIAIFEEIVPRIAEQNPRILVVVANPVDILTRAALDLSGYPMNRVMGSGTILDTARFEYLMGQHCGVDPRSVRAHVIGEHGDSEVAVWSQVNIGGVPLKDYCPVCERSCTPEERTKLFDKVRQAAYEVIEKKGATYFAIALGLVRMCACILRDERSVLTISTLLDDYYGVSGVCLSIPVVLGRNGILKLIRIDLSEEEREAFVRSAETLTQAWSRIDSGGSHTARLPAEGE